MTFKITSIVILTVLSGCTRFSVQHYSDSYKLNKNGSVTARIITRLCSQARRPFICTRFRDGHWTVEKLGNDSLQVIVFAEKTNTIRRRYIIVDYQVYVEKDDSTYEFQKKISRKRFVRYLERQTEK